jgi:hypothetical protein
VAEDLFTQLRAALDEDERVALAASEAEAYITLTLTAKPPGGDEGARALVEHHRRHNPARVLRWVAYARGVLGQHKLITLADGRVTCDACFDGGGMGYPCADVRALAGVYGIGEG